MRLLIFLCVTLSSCGTLKPTETNKKYLREYSFCRCMYHSFQDSSFRDEISSSIYLDIGGYDLEVYEIADSLAKKFAENIKPSIIKDHDGKKAVMFECFKLYNGKQIDSLTKTSQKRKFQLK